MGVCDDGPKDAGIFGLVAAASGNGRFVRSAHGGRTHVTCMPFSSPESRSPV